MLFVKYYQTSLYYFIFLLLLLKQISPGKQRSQPAYSLNFAKQSFFYFASSSVGSGSSLPKHAEPGHNREMPSEAFHFNRRHSEHCLEVVLWNTFVSVIIKVYLQRLVCVHLRFALLLVACCRRLPV